MKSSAPKAVAYKYVEIVEPNFGPPLTNLKSYSEDIEVSFSAFQVFLVSAKLFKKKVCSTFAAHSYVF